MSHEAIHKVQESVVINRPLADVFAFVSDPRNDSKWRRDVVAVRSTSNRPPAVGSTFTWVVKPPAGREDEMEIELAEYEPHRRVRIRAMSGAMRPELTYLFEPVGGATRVTRAVDVRCGPRYMEREMRKIITKRNAAYVADLKAVLERETGSSR